MWSKLSAVKWTDAWEERFYGNPSSVISEIKGGKSIRVEVYCKTENEAEAIREQFGGSVRELKSRNWVAMGAPKVEPLMIRDRIVIPQVEVEPGTYPGRQVIMVPPEMAFGTGDHPTTATCLRFLVDQAVGLGNGWHLHEQRVGGGKM